MSTLYENIKTLCDEKGVTGGKMCLDIGASKSLMTGLKKGRTKGINIETAQKIADYFDVPVERVLGTQKGPSLSVEPNKDYLLAALDNMSRDELLEHLELVTKKLRERDKR